MENAIIYFFSYITEAVIIWLYTLKLFIPRYSVKRRILILGTVLIFLFLLCLLEMTGLNAFLFLIMFFVFLWTQYELRWYTALFHSAIFTAIMAMCELIAYSIISYFSPNFFSGPSLFQNMVIHAIFSKLLLFGIIYTLVSALKDIQKPDIAHVKTSVLLGFIPITSIFVMITLITIDNANPSVSVKWMITISAILLLGLNFLVFAINQHDRKKSAEHTELQLLLQKESASLEYHKMLLAQNENHSILIHDIKKHLQSIELLNNQHESEKINQYIESVLNSSNMRETLRICDHELMNAIMNRYMRQCKEKDILFQIDIRSNTLGFMKDYDITALFCNLLDNATEAAAACPAACIDLRVTHKENTPLTIVSLVNSCHEAPKILSTNMILSRKPDKAHHGYGLKSIHRVVERYNGNIKMYYDREQRNFHTVIALNQ